MGRHDGTFARPTQTLERANRHLKNKEKSEERSKSQEVGFIEKDTFLRLKCDP